MNRIHPSQFVRNLWTRVPSMTGQQTEAAIESGYAPQGLENVPPVMGYGQGLQSSMQGNPLLEELRNPSFFNNLQPPQRYPGRI